MAAETTPSPSKGASPSTSGARPTLASAMRSSSYLREHQQYRPPKMPPHPESHFGIDTVVEDFGAVSLGGPRVVSAGGGHHKFSGVPDKDRPPRIVDSGLNHDLSHPNCCPPPGAPRSDRLVATLFYKARSPRISNAVPSPRLRPAADSSLSAAGNRSSFVLSSSASSSSLALPVSQQQTAIPSSQQTNSTAATTNSDMPSNLGPTDSFDEFPMEPPVGDMAEPLDHLYGSYISPLCVASFLHLMSTFPPPPRRGADGLGPADDDDDEEPRSWHRCLDSARHPLVVELTLDPAPSPSYLSLADLRRHELIYRFEREWNVDVALQRDVVWRRHPRLVVFDMDSTLITQEVIDLLAARAGGGVAAKVAAITHRAMLGELEFDAAFRERVALLAGLPASVFTQLRSALDVTEGARPLLRALRRLGVRTAVLSGGFLPLTSWLAGELGIDYAHANEVEVDPATGALTGRVREGSAIVGKLRKKELLLEIVEREGLQIDQVVAVGDGANDLLMMGAAGLGVAWNAKPVVQMEAGARLNGSSLLDLLYLFGFTREEIEMLAA